jgi:hypothetical protein
MASRVDRVRQWHGTDLERCSDMVWPTPRRLALHRARKPDTEWYLRKLPGGMRGEFLNENLFFGLDHDRSAIEHWVADFNAYRPHFALGYQTPADVWRDPGCSDEIPTILDVDDALAVPAHTMPLRFREDGLDRPEWTIALQVTASANLTVHPTPSKRLVLRSGTTLILLALRSPHTRAPGDFWWVLRQGPPD